MKYILNRWYLGIALAAMLASLALVFVYVPTERTMGIVQRIFYFHVPVDWAALLAFCLVFVFSILYLAKRNERYDFWAYASAEVGVVFTSLMLMTGTIWAKPAWGVWWVWDTRLTTALVLWLIYLAYLMVRSFATDESRAARFGAVIGIVGFIDVPIVALSIQLWRTQHPAPTIFTGGLEPAMVMTLMVCLVAFTLLFVYLTALAARLRMARRALLDLKEAHDLDKE